MFKFDKKGILAILNLAIQFNIHIFKRIFPLFIKKDGIEVFEENYRNDNLFSLTEEERNKLFNFEKCINCGICSSQCVVLSVLEKNNFLEPRFITSSLSRALNEFNTNIDIIYNCLICEACKVLCPQGIPIPEVVSFIKNKILKKPPLNYIKLLNLKNTGNIYGEKKEDFNSFEKENAEYVFFIGCVGRYREKESIKKTLSLLKLLNVNFTTIKELHCGRSIITSSDNLELFEKIIKENIKRIQEKNTNKVITSCPECYYTFKNNPHYKEKIKTFHLTSFLNNFKFPLERKDDKITYHDPCDLGRISSIYEEPRNLIKNITTNFVEMENIREFSHCCGSREGCKIEDNTIVKKLSEKRIEEANKTGAKILLTECPSCLKNLKTVAKEIEVYSISEYIFQLLNK